MQLWEPVGDLDSGPTPDPRQDAHNPSRKFQSVAPHVWLLLLYIYLIL